MRLLSDYWFAQAPRFRAFALSRFRAFALSRFRAFALSRLAVSACMLLPAGGCQRAESSGDLLNPAALDSSNATESGGEPLASTDAAANDSRHRDLLFEHDFGLIRPHQRVTHAFSVTNNSEVPWTLRHVERTCVCTVAKCPRRIEPRSTAEVEVEYRAAGATADDRRAVELYFEEDGAPVVRFEVEVSVRPPIAASRDEIIFRGARKNYRARQTFEVENWSGLDWSSLTLGADVAWARASAELDRVEESAHGPLQVWQVNVDVDARDMKPGRHNGALRIHADGDAEARLPMWLELAGPVSVVPEQMFFGNIGPGGHGTCTVLVKCAACTAEELAERLVVRHDLGDRLRLEFSPRSSKLLEIKGTLDLPKDSQRLRGSVVLEAGDQDATRIELPVLAER